MALSKEEILQAIEEMKVIELHELVEAIKEKFNVTAAMPVAAVAAAPAAGGAAAQGERRAGEKRPCRLCPARRHGGRARGARRDAGVRRL